VSHRRAALIIAATLAIAPAARASTVWTAIASEKIRPDAAARAEATSAAIAAAKNEFEAFQIVVSGPATNVSASASDLKGPGTIGGLKLFREALLDVSQPSAADGATGRFPDPLVPDVDDVVGEKRNAFPFDVPAGESRAIWVEAHVPQNAAAGAYTGTVTIHANDGDHVVPVSLTVWDFTLPSTASLKSSFALGAGVMSRHAAKSGDELSKLRVRYGQLALDHRVSLHSVWNDGNKDWTHFDAFYGPLLDGKAQTQLEGAKLTSVESGASLSSVDEHRAWATHFKQHGWFDKLFQYTCDEPPITCQWADIPARAGVAKQADPEFRTLVTTDMEQAQKNGGAGMLAAIDLMVPVVNFLDDRPPSAYGWTPGGEKAADYAPFRAMSPKKELWLYQSCMSHGCGGTVDIGNPSADQLYYTGWPSYAVDVSSVRSRSMEWLSFRYGATGELYYETVQAYYERDPWQSVYEFSGNGDGTLFYPGTIDAIGGQTEIPVTSIRMKMIREGMEDFEYLKLLADLGDKDTAKQIAAKLFPHAYEADAKPEDLMGAREAIARKILALSNKVVPAAGASAGTNSVAKFDALVMGAGGCGSSSTGGSGFGLVSALLVPLGLAFRGLRRKQRSA
jgi:hypothetical protein